MLGRITDYLERGSRRESIPFEGIDNERCFVVEKLAGLKQTRFDAPEAVEAKLKKMQHYTCERY